MKKLVLIGILMFLFASCSLDDGAENNFQYEFMPIESVEIPEEFVLGEVYTIYVTYNRPSGCHVFNNFYYESDLNQRTIAVVNTVYSNLECEQFEDNLEEVSFNFKVNSNGSYIFRFWQGEDENGDDVYFIVEVPVVD